MLLVCLLVSLHEFVSARHLAKPWFCQMSSDTGRTSNITQPGQQTKFTPTYPLYHWSTVPLGRPGGMRGAFESAAPRRGAGRVLNFGIYSSDSHPRGSSRMPPDAQIMILQPLPFSYFFCFLPISYFVAFIFICF